MICFRNMAEYILSKQRDMKGNDAECEAERIVTVAAEIIKDEIKNEVYNQTSYPTNEDISNIKKGHEWIPTHLILKIVVLSEVKQNSIGHAIVQSSRPRSVITPTLFGVGVEMDHVFGSKWLVNELSHLGFSISYDEVTRYRQSVIQSETPETLLSEYKSGTFTQWVADNVDHNTITLDGQGTFHGVGIIAISTPHDKVSLKAS